MPAPTCSRPCAFPRTTFDLLFRVLRLPMGSEVLMSGITIKDMVKIAQHHGCKPVAVDVTFDTVGVTAAALEAAITPSTRMIVIAHVFGVLNDMTEVCRVAAKHGLVVVEDCAECFMGPPAAAVGHTQQSTLPVGYTGHPDADLTLFSFGTIKTSTAFGACIASIKDATLHSQLHKLHEGYPLRPRSVLAGRLARYGAMHSITTPAVYGALVKAVEGTGHSWDELVTGAIRGFPGPQLINLIRYAPSTPLLHLLLRRLEAFPTDYLHARVAAGWAAVAELAKFPPGTALVPGTKATHHAFWLFPVLVPKPAEVCKAMLLKGFDVTQGTSQLGPVCRYTAASNLTPHFKANWPVVAEAIMTGLVYLPITAETSDAQLKAIMAALRDIVVAQGVRIQPPQPLHDAKL